MKKDKIVCPFCGEKIKGLPENLKIKNIIKITNQILSGGKKKKEDA